MSKSRYDPFRHHRRSIRYTNWDYRTPGYYFITICTQGRENLFDAQVDRDVAEERLLALPGFDQFPHCEVDVWVVMPNHVHLIVWLVTWPAGIADEPEKVEEFTHVQAGSIGAIVSTYKSQVTRRINRIHRQKGAKIWQMGYWDRIIRNDDELNKTRQYIIDNPARWDEDRDNLDSLLDKMVFHR